MSEKIIILGAGGHAKVIADIIVKNGGDLVGFLDDKKKGEILGYPILGNLNSIGQYENGCRFVIGIGNNAIRKSIAEKFKVLWATIKHPSVIVANDVDIGEGTVIMAGVVINPSTRIGRHCIINTSAVIEHDNIIDDYVHISPNATLCGSVKVGELTHIGAGAVVKNNIDICDASVIGAGAVVVSNITTVGTYVGVPAKKMFL